MRIEKLIFQYSYVNDVRHSSLLQDQNDSHQPSNDQFMRAKQLMIKTNNRLLMGMIGKGYLNKDDIIYILQTFKIDYDYYNMKYFDITFI